MDAAVLEDRLRAGDTSGIAAWLSEATARQVVDELTRLDPADTALVFRLLPRERALEVFEDLEPIDQQQVLDGLRDERTLALFEAMDPDDRVRLLDEMPAKVVARLLSQLSEPERALTTTLLGYPEESAGRHMSPEFVSLRGSFTAQEALDKIRREGLDVETVYALPVVDDERRLIGITGLRRVVLADPDTRVSELMTTAVHQVSTDTDREVAARLIRDEGLIALPVVDNEGRLVGVVTVDDAMEILEAEETEDLAFHGGHSPLGKPYLSVGVLDLARARGVWLLMLIVAAALTVNVLQLFEDALSKVVVLALFIPLLTGTGGNAGAQASTAVIRAMAVGDVRVSDLPRIVWREAKVGVLLGLLLGSAVFVPVSLAWEADIALVVGLTLVSVCTWATIAGSTLPLLARKLGADPAVVSAPVITTVVDATGLLIYFSYAIAILGI